MRVAPTASCGWTDGGAASCRICFYPRHIDAYSAYDGRSGAGRIPAGVGIRLLARRYQLYQQRQPRRFVLFLYDGCGLHIFGRISGYQQGISATEIFDPTTDTVTVNSSTTLGTSTYSTVATNTLTVAPDLVKDMEKRNIPEKMVDGVKVNDEEWSTLENRENGRTIDLVYLTDNGMRVPIPPTPSIDMYRPLPGTWTFDQLSTPLLFGVSSTGSSPSIGGARTFTSNLVAIPEPTP